MFVNFYVVLVPLLAPYFLKEKHSIKVIASAMLGLLGAFFVTTNMNFKENTVDSIKGNLLTLCSGVLWTVYIIISKKHLERNEELTGMAVFFGTTVWSAVFLGLITPFILINKSWNQIVAGFT